MIDYLVLSDSFLFLIIGITAFLFGTGKLKVVQSTTISWLTANQTIVKRAGIFTFIIGLLKLFYVVSRLH